MVPFPQVSPPTPCISLSPPYTRYMPGLSHISRFYHPNNIECAVQIIRLLIMWFSPLHSPRPSYAQIFSSTPYSQTLSVHLTQSLYPLSNAMAPSVWSLCYLTSTITTFSKYSSHPSGAHVAFYCVSGNFGQG